MFVKLKFIFAINIYFGGKSLPKKSQYLFGFLNFFSRISCIYLQVSKLFDDIQKLQQKSTFIQCKLGSFEKETILLKRPTFSFLTLHPGRTVEQGTDTK